MRPPHKRLRWLLLAVMVLAAYPIFVFASVYSHWFAADLPGGLNGPADAYRHSLASATVAYTGSAHWVEWVTAVMERDGKGSEARAMDAHNNRIGARIGHDANSWEDMQDTVLHAVRSGRVHADDFNQITWLPPERWQNRLY
ncbi:MAG: hypothetical protein LH470_08405 [Lysobacter sp.]|nr:hypothetical protein [Lysobacter sp.]